MNACPTCGKQHDPTVRFCPEDGTPLSETATASGTRTPTTTPSTIKVELALPVTVGNRYNLTEVRGGGGRAKVYLAVLQTPDRQGALRLIIPPHPAAPDSAARFPP